MVHDSNPAELLTADQKPIIVDHYTVWQITDPLLFVQNTQTMARAEQRIDAAVYSTVRGVLGRLKFGEIISEGESARGNLNPRSPGWSTSSWPTTASPSTTCG